jgi:hypothetical protein
MENLSSKELRNIGVLSIIAGILIALVQLAGWPMLGFRGNTLVLFLVLAFFSLAGSFLCITFFWLFIKSIKENLSGKKKKL